MVLSHESSRIAILVPTDDKTNKVIGFAFVEMVEQTQVLAISELNSIKWMGYQLQVRKHYSPNTTLILKRYAQIRLGTG